MKTICLLLISLIGFSMAQINPQPVSQFDLMDAQGFWYIVYFAPNPLNVTNGSAIYCWDTQFYVAENNITVHTIDTINILGKSIKKESTGKITNGNANVWAYSLATYAWLDFDIVDESYGLIASMNSSLFFVVSRDPELSDTILQKEIAIAQAQGYTVNGNIVPANIDCPY